MASPRTRAVSHANRDAPDATPRDTATVVLIALAGATLFVGWGAVSQSVAVDRAAAIVGVAGVLAAAIAAMRAPAPPGITRLSLAWGGFLAWGALSAVGSGRPWAALVGENTSLLGSLTLVTFTAIVLATARTEADSVRRPLALAAITIVALELMFAAAQLLLGRTPAGTLPNSTYLGETLVILLPILFAERDRTDATGALWLRYGLSASAIVVLAASGSRTAAVVALAWGVWLLATRVTARRTMKLLAVAMVLVAAVTSALSFARTEVLGTLEATSLGQRPEMWSVAIDAAMERPLLGYGPDGFISGGVAVTTPERASAGEALLFAPGKTDPHNLLVWTLVSTGFVGAALFLWTCAEVVARWMRRRRAGHDIAPFAWAVIGAFAVFLTAPMTIHVIGLLGIVLGMSLGRPGDEEPAWRLPVASRVLSWVLTVVLAVGSLTYAANTATRMALEEHGPLVSSSKTAAAQTAMELWAFDAHLATLASLHWGWAAQGDPAVLEAQPDLAAIRRAAAVDRRDPFAALELARTLRFHGAPDAEQEAAFRASIGRWPLHPTARAEYAVFLAQRGRADEAHSQLAVAELVESVGDRDLEAAIAEARALLGR